MASLLENIAVAMLETDDAGFNTALEVFVAGESIEAVGPEIRRGLTVALPSGAEARTEEIVNLVVEEIEKTAGSSSHQILTSWTARVSGGHWGHMHRRKISYRGLAEISQIDGTWFLNGLTVLNAQEAG
jgi:hypothetical protein